MRRALVAVALSRLLLLTAVPAAAGPPDAYSAAEIRGSVVDAETKQPLEGVHVVAQWILYTVISPFQMHQGRGTPLEMLETVTGPKGEYHFPSWGPKPRPVFTRLDEFADPQLTFFKPGYRVLARSNAGPPHDNAVRTSRWGGKTIALQPFRGAPDEWVYVLEHVQARLSWGEQTDDIPPRLNDYWRHFPRVVLIVMEQRRLLPAQLQYRVRDIRAWGITEEELRTLANQKSQPQ